MLSNEELVAQLRKAAITTALGGLVSPQQAREFIDLSVDQTAILNEIRTESDIQVAMELHDWFLSEPVTVSGTEATEPDAADVTTPTIVKKTLQPKEAVAAFDVSFDMIRQNIAQLDPTGQGYGGNAFSNALNRLFAKRMGKDFVLMAFSGDTSIVGTSRTDKALKHMDGFIKIAENDATVKDFTIPGSPTYSGKTGVFTSMLKLLPKDYRDDRSVLRFFVSQNVIDAYEDEIADRQTDTADKILFGQGVEFNYKRIKIVPVFGQSDDRIILTPQENLAIGWGRRMMFGMDVYNRKRTVEVTVTADVDADIVRGDALVLGATA